MSTYQDLIRQMDPTVNPAGVEACMRLQARALDSFTREEFATEVAMARECESQSPGFLRRVAESFGMGADFARWEARQ